MSKRPDQLNEEFEYEAENPHDLLGPLLESFRKGDLIQSAKRWGKTEVTRRAMKEALDSGEHVHLARIGRTEGVNCPTACRAAGVAEWGGEG